MDFFWQIVRALDGDSSLEDLTNGVKPGQSMLLTSSSEHESGSYASNMSRFRRAAFDSNELSQEYSGLTSDYGLNPSSSSSSGDISTTMPHPQQWKYINRKHKSRISSYLLELCWREEFWISRLLFIYSDEVLLATIEFIFSFFTTNLLLS